MRNKKAPYVVWGENKEQGKKADKDGDLGPVFTSATQPPYCLANLSATSSCAPAGRGPSRSLRQRRPGALSVNPEGGRRPTPQRGAGAPGFPRVYLYRLNKNITYFSLSDKVTLFKTSNTPPNTGKALW